MLIHPITQKSFESLAERLPHANIIVGEPGTGKLHSVLELIKRLEPDQATTIDHGNFERILTVDSDKNSVGIEAIKELESLLKLSDSKRRYVVVPHAHKLTHEAQNAFLKTFEESPAQVTSFLLVHNINQLLTTIRSRAQTVQFIKPTRKDFITWLQTDHRLSATDAEKTYYLTSGRPAEALALLKNDMSFKQLQQDMQVARELLTATPSQRLQHLKSVEKDSAALEALIMHIHTLCRAALIHAAKQNDAHKTQAWSKKVGLCMELRQYIHKNVNPRLITDKLVLNL